MIFYYVNTIEILYFNGEPNNQVMEYIIPIFCWNILKCMKSCKHVLAFYSQAFNNYTDEYTLNIH